MRLVLAYRTLDAPAGSETYLVLVAEQLQALGHDVTVWTPAPGQMAEVARGRGIAVRRSLDELPREVDGLLAQDGETAYELAARHPGVPLVFVAHSALWAGQEPPRLPDALTEVVVMNERLRERVAAGPGTPAVVRLRQPVDRERSRFGPPSSGLAQVVLLGHHTSPPRLEAVAKACVAVGVELKVVGGRNTTVTPELEIARADAVLGVGRSVLEGMAAGRAAYVLGNDGADGWVTPESYPALEADGFAGRASDRTLDPETLAQDLAAWSPQMGEANRDLIARHHDAAEHATQLVERLRAAATRPGPPPAPIEELARLVRLASGLENRALASELRRAREVAELNERLRYLTGSRRWQVAAAIARPLDVIRRLRGPGR